MWSDRPRESKIWSDEQMEQKLENYLRPRGPGGKFTWYADAYRALGLFPNLLESRAAMHGALKKLDRERHARGELPLCVLMREEREDEYALTRRLLLELGYLEEGDDPGPVCTELRRKWMTWHTDGLEYLVL